MDAGIQIDWNTHWRQSLMNEMNIATELVLK